MTKTLNYIIFFSSTKIRIFFSATLGIRILIYLWFIYQNVSNNYKGTTISLERGGGMFFFLKNILIPNVAEKSRFWKKMKIKEITIENDKH
jgi:hypothetical protein